MRGRGWDRPSFLPSRQKPRKKKDPHVSRFCQGARHGLPKTWDCEIIALSVAVSLLPLPLSLQPGILYELMSSCNYLVPQLVPLFFSSSSSAHFEINFTFFLLLPSLRVLSLPGA